MTKDEVLKNCTISGLVVKLPEVQLDRKIYQEVSSALGLIGGTWNRKSLGFVFHDDPTELLEEIANGEKRNLKKEFQFFGTPDSLADYLVELAEVDADDEILEPSAGQGAIIKAIGRVLPNKQVDFYELMPLNKKILDKIPTAFFLGDDFLKFNSKYHDKIIANPPFSKNQDLTHVLKMYDSLSSGGRLVSVMSNHWRTSTNKKEVEFKNWYLLMNF